MRTIQNPTKEQILEAFKTNKAFWDNIGVKFTVEGDEYVKTHLGAEVARIPINMMYIDMYGHVMPKKAWVQRK